ncbi:hypothetical protein H5410_003888 [Solanum commersonii]|uniref:Uncharacterized protein n=1 Tax=Solanum commersonii TaxID=4109 RepID=A0A9J6B6D5_SOLCO|nr:hypothetical protein H5410_003888 [Solanum commersonii]
METEAATAPQVAALADPDINWDMLDKSHVSSLCLLMWNLGYSDNVDKEPSHMQMVAIEATTGLAASTCSSVITTLVNTVKTRLQVIDNYGVGRHYVLKTTKMLLREDGWKGFYRGLDLGSSICLSMEQQ